MTLNRRHLLLAATSLAFANAQAGGVSDTEIVIGTQLDLSGPVAAGSPRLRNGMQLRVDEVNAAGGINGRKVRLIVEDNGSQPQMAVRAVQKLIKSDNVFAIVNGFGSGPNAATVKLATGAGVVVFAPWAASAVIQKISGHNPLLFTTVQNYDASTGSALSWAIKNWGSKRVGVIYQEGPFGDLIRAGVDKAMKNAGMTVAAEAAYKAGDIDFSSQVARMKAANVDLILAGTVVRETVGVMTEVKKLNWKDVKVLTAVPGRSTIVAQLGKQATEGLYGTGGWQIHDDSTTNADAKNFLSNYKKHFNSEADENAGLAYSYMSWFLDIAKAAGKDLTAESFAKAAQGVTHQDFVTYAPQHFEGNHSVPESVSIDQIQGGKWVQLVPPFSGLVK